MRFHKMAFTIGGEPDSLNETKLFVTMKVSTFLLIDMGEMVRWLAPWFLWIGVPGSNPRQF